LRFQQHKTYVKYLSFKLYYQQLHWHTCVTLQVTNYKLPEDDTTVSKHVGGV